VHEIKKILLVKNEAQQPCRAELRASMLSAQLNVRCLETIPANTTSLGVAPATSFGHIELGNSASCALADGPRNLLALPLRGDVRTKQAATPAAIVVERAAQTKADLIIIAPHRRHFFLEWFRPSYDREIVRMSRRPLLLVNTEPKGDYKKVLVAVDFSQESLAAARAALLAAPSAHFTFLHAYRVPDEGMMRELEVPAAIINSYRLRGWEAARGRLNEWIDWLGPKTQMTRSVHYGSPVPVITACARSIGADLVVIGKRGQKRFQRKSLGSVARRLTSQTNYDVLIAAAP